MSVLMGCAQAASAGTDLGWAGPAGAGWAGVAAALAVLVATAPTLRPVRRWGRVPVAAATAAVLWLLVVGASPRVIVPVLLLALLGTAIQRIRLRARRGRRAAEVAARVRECCESLAGELAVGIPPGQALQAPCAIWEPWAQVVSAHHVGGSVPEAMHALAAGHPGAADLHQVAAAWELSQHAGSALTASLSTVADDIAEKQSTRALVRTELSSARSTARLVVALPVLTLAVGSGTGDPVGWLLGSPAGWICLAAGGALALAGLAWIEAIAAAVERESG